MVAAPSWAIDHMSLATPIEKAVIAGTPDLVPANIASRGRYRSADEDGPRIHSRASTQGRREFYDYILIDCPPSLGILTINGLTAASEVLIPVQAEALSHRGVGQLLETIRRHQALYESRSQSFGRHRDDVRPPHPTR